MSRQQRISRLESFLRQSIDTLRSGIHHPTTCLETSGDEGMFTYSERDGMFYVAPEDWKVSYSIHSFEIDDSDIDLYSFAQHIIRTLVQYAEGLEVQKFLEVGGNCRCYQSSDWSYLHTDTGGIIHQYRTLHENFYVVILKKEAIFI